MKKYTQKKEKVLDTFDVVEITFLILMVLPTCFPMVTLLLKGVIMTLGGFLGWLIIVLIKRENYAYLKNFKNIYPVVFLGVLYFVAYSFYNPIYGNRYLDMAILFFGPVIYEYYKSMNKQYIFKYVFMILAPLVLFTAFKTGHALIKDPYISRLIKSDGSAQTAAILRQGVSGYSLMYMLTCLSSVFLYIFLKEKTLKKKSFFLSLYIGSIVVIILSNYFTALITCVLSFVILIIMNEAEKQGSLFVIFVIAVGIIFVVFGNEIINGLIELIIKIAPEGKTAERLSLMQGNFLKEFWKEMEYDRLPTLKKSVKTFVENPIFGVMTSGEVLRMQFDGLGQHSHILDTLAIWGVIFGSVNIRILFLPFTKERRIICRPLWTVVWLDIIIIFLFNNAINSVAFVLHWVFPFVCDYYKKEKIMMEERKEGVVK